MVVANQMALCVHVIKRESTLVMCIFSLLVCVFAKENSMFVVFRNLLDC